MYNDFFRLDAVKWDRYLQCPLCGFRYYHGYRCPESDVDWDDYDREEALEQVTDR